jgi:glycosyltransferase involved in cell wall biosynthesis
VLFTPDDPLELADQILGLATNPQRAARLGQEGAAGVRRHFSAARMAERTLEVYGAVLRGDRQPATVLAGA